MPQFRAIIFYSGIYLSCCTNIAKGKGTSNNCREETVSQWAAPSVRIVIIPNWSGKKSEHQRWGWWGEKNGKPWVTLLASTLMNLCWHITNHHFNITAKRSFPPMVMQATIYFFEKGSFDFVIKCWLPILRTKSLLKDLHIYLMARIILRSMFLIWELEENIPLETWYSSTLILTSSAW